METPEAAWVDIVPSPSVVLAPEASTSSIRDLPNEVNTASAAVVPFV